MTTKESNQYSEVGSNKLSVLTKWFHDDIYNTYRDTQKIETLSLNVVHLCDTQQSGTEGKLQLLYISLKAPTVVIVWSLFIILS